jgi:hypothetical protein
MRKTIIGLFLLLMSTVQAFAQAGAKAKNELTRRGSLPDTTTGARTDSTTGTWLRRGGVIEDM